MGYKVLIGGIVVIMCDVDNMYEVIEDGVVLILDNCIVVVGKCGEIEIFSDVMCIDMLGKIILLGLVDVYVYGVQGCSEIIL